MRYSLILFFLLESLAWAGGTPIPTATPQNTKTPVPTATVTPTYNKTPIYSKTPAVSITNMNPTVGNDSNLYASVSHAIQQELNLDPLGMGYKNLSKTGQIASMQVRCTDTNQKTCLFAFPLPVSVTSKEVNSVTWW